MWRLAYLLSCGDAVTASGVLRDVVRAQPDLAAIDAAHVERLVILRSREARAARRPLGPGARKVAGPSGAGAEPPGSAGTSALSALATLPFQGREAWCLSRLDGLELHDVSRAMDCSTTAIQRHLDLADKLMHAALGSSFSESVAALRSHADALDPAPMIAALRASRKRSRARALVYLAALVCLLIAIAYEVLS